MILFCISLQACTLRQPINRATQQAPPQRDHPEPIIHATPLPEPSLPPILAINPQHSPWLKTEFLQLTQTQAVETVKQGLWVQSTHQAHAAHQEKTPLSAASVTKIATTLAALERLGPEFRFSTKIGYSGKITDQTLEGDLIVLGGDDPFFIWEDVFAIALLLEQSGIQTITGDLVIQAPFVMNFESDSELSGTLLKQGLNSKLWPQEAIAQFNTLPAGTPKPEIVLQGNIRVSETPNNTTWLIQHQSLPLIELLKRMNRYSNNPMADQIANYLGGGTQVTQIVRSLTGLSDQEVNFINGSGLGPENKITPQGATLMLQALSNLLQSKNMSLGDVMTIVGQDEGILDPRPLPPGLVVKSGTLDQVSALAGVLPTQTEGPVWFTILNTQGDVTQFRQQQEALLQSMVSTWGSTQLDPLLRPTLQSSQLTTITKKL